MPTAIEQELRMLGEQDVGLPGVGLEIELAHDGDEGGAVDSGGGAVHGITLGCGIRNKKESLIRFGIAIGGTGLFFQFTIRQFHCEFDVPSLFFEVPYVPWK